MRVLRRGPTERRRRWMIRGMTWGVPKRGIMIILPRRRYGEDMEEEREHRRAQLVALLTGAPAGTLEEQQLPIVREYTYLGLTINDELVARNAAMGGDDADAWSKFASEWVRESKVWYTVPMSVSTDRFLARGRAASWGRYKRFDFETTRPTEGAQMFPVAHLGYGITAVCHARLNSLRGAGRVHAHDGRPRLCYFCDAGVDESIAHLLVGCTAWRHLRAQHLGGMLHAIQGIRGGPFNMEETAATLLGGQTNQGRLDDWQPSIVEPPPDADVAELAATGGLLSVARFLRDVNQQRIRRRGFRPL